MASNACWRCLARPRAQNGIAIASTQSSILRTAPAAAFSTSAVLSAKGSGSAGLPSTKHGSKSATPKRGEKTTFSTNKKKRADEPRAKRPDVGERKALRKRVVLSNPNAIEVQELTKLEENITINEDQKGQIISLPNELIDRLKALEAFEARQSWNMFRRPSTLVRDNTIELAKLFAQPPDSEPHSNVSKRVIVGAKGSGKTVYLLQAMALAMTNNWTVIHIPEVRDLTIAQTDYSPVPGSKPTLYNQKHYLSTLLKRIARANPHLSALKLSATPNLPVPVQENMSLARLAGLGSDPDLALPVFQALWAELTAPTRPPILLTLDNFSRANEATEYMSSSFKKIHAHDLWLIDWFLGCFTGKTALPNGGAVFAAMSGNNAPRNPALEIRLRQIEAHQGIQEGTFVPEKDLTIPFLEATEQVPNPIPAADPFIKYDGRVLDVLGGREAALSGSREAGGVVIKRVEPVSREEARALMEYWARSGMIRARVDEGFVGTKWTLAGGGVLGELEKGCFGMRI
ncbi:MAG: 37S ribosomal protein S23 mitochondrial [Stictis urceolatum]|nr:37S ribosomal protein S23 mitochondrial [Stictis urceolata]